MKIAVIGAGAWGTALALISHRAGHYVRIWARQQQLCDQINQLHENIQYLPGIRLPDAIEASTELDEFADFDILMLTVPAQSIRQVTMLLSNINLSKNTIIVSCSKGIEQKSLKLMSEIITDILPNKDIAILSGPNFADEIAKNLPAITSIACEDKNLAQKLSDVLGNSKFRIYPNNDIIGTQIIGATKNVLAIAAGITIGKEFGENAKAAVISRGIYEINRLILAKAGQTQTLLTPAGIGDINLTCSSERSRNTAYGIALGQGNDHRDIITSGLVEGYYTVESLVLLAQALNINMPICEAIYKITRKQSVIDDIVEELLERSVND